MYIGVVIGILMFLPVSNGVMTPKKNEKSITKMPVAIVDRSIIGPAPSTLSIVMGKK